MWQALKLRWKSFLIFLAVLGPGIITAAVDNDAPGIATYSIAGATFEFNLLWSLVPIMILLIIIQEMCIRMGIVTGKGLSDLIREKFGVKITFILVVGLFITNFGNVIAEFAGIAASSQLFAASSNFLVGSIQFLVVPLCAIFIWLLVVQGNYKSVEKAFLAATLFYFSYVLAGIMAAPDWMEVASKTIAPTIEFSHEYLLLFVGLVGTTIAPWMQFYLQAAVVEKGVKKEELKFSRADVVLGSLVTIVVAFFIIVTTASTLFKNGVRIETAADAASALAPLAGVYASYLFSFGLFIAALFAAAILPLSTAFVVCESFGWDSGIDRRFREAPEFYTIFTALIVLGAVIVLLPGIPIIPIMLFSQVLNGILLPFVLIFMLLLINDKKLMGEHTNSKLFNVIAWASSAFLIILSIILVASTLAMV
ncbi:MAG: Nramp family divalent metal transporter [Candidatus Diapherotrites archaeon]